MHLPQHDLHLPVGPLHRKALGYQASPKDGYQYRYGHQTLFCDRCDLHTLIVRVKPLFSLDGSVKPS